MLKQIVFSITRTASRDKLNKHSVTKNCSDLLLQCCNRLFSRPLEQFFLTDFLVTKYQYLFRSYFSAYKEEFENSEHQQETPETLLETIEKHEKEIKDKETSTALLNHIKEKKSEKIRQRQEKFDQRKKRDEDRRKAKGGLFLLCCKMN